MSFTSDQIQAINQLIDNRLTTREQFGTVTARTSYTTAMVQLDPSQGSIPAKVSADSTVDEGDRVALVKVGLSQWMILGSLTYRGRRPYPVADRNTRLAIHTADLVDGDRVFQQDTGVPYFWNGSQWVVEAGATLYAWVKGPGLGTNNRILVGVTNEVSVRVTPTIEMEGNNLFYMSSSLMCASGVAGTHFFHTFIKASSGGTVVVQSGETPYTGTFDPIRSTIAQAGVITTGVTFAQLELTVKDQSGAAYDVYGDQDDPAWFYVVGAGVAAGSVDST